MKSSSLIIISIMFLVTNCDRKAEDKMEREVAENNTGQIVHHVFFWLQNPDSEADKEKLIEGLNTLRKIDEVQELIIGTPASTLEREVVDNSFHVSELMIFESVKAQDVYQNHPVHQAFVDKYSHLWERVVVYDVKVE